MSDPVTTPCPFCEADIGVNAKKCRYCGEWVARDCLECGTPVRKQWAARGLCAECQVRRSVARADDHSGVPVARPVGKSRSVAVAAALLFGGIGAHKFYLGRPGKGLLYILFCWTFIPALLGLFEGAKFALMREDEFQRRYSW